MPKYVPVYVRKLIIDRFLRNDAPELIANDYNVAKSYIYGLVNRYIANGSLLTQMERNKKMNNNHINNKRRNVIIPPMEHLLMEQYKDNDLSTLYEYRKLLNDYDCSYSSIWHFFKEKDYQ